MTYEVMIASDMNICTCSFRMLDFNLKMHICDEGVVELRVLVDGLVAGANHLQQLLPPLERVVVLPDQKTDERKLKLSQNFFNPKKTEQKI